MWPGKLFGEGNSELYWEDELSMCIISKEETGTNNVCVHGADCIKWREGKTVLIGRE